MPLVAELFEAAGCNDGSIGECREAGRSSCARRLPANGILSCLPPLLCGLCVGFVPEPVQRDFPWIDRLSFV